MELVYLWVEEYKNIKEQGFNFSPRFDCKYDKDSNELTIDKNKDYVSIFPDNINVTAIVGENGSGKSAICKSIFDQEENIKLKNTKCALIKNFINNPINEEMINVDVFLVYFDKIKGKYIYYTNNEYLLISINKKEVLLEQKRNLKELNSFYLNNGKNELLNINNNLSQDSLFEQIIRLLIKYDNFYTFYNKDYILKKINIKINRATLENKFEDNKYKDFLINLKKVILNLIKSNIKERKYTGALKKSKEEQYLNSHSSEDIFIDLKLAFLTSYFNNIIQLFSNDENIKEKFIKTQKNYFNNLTLDNMIEKLIIFNEEINAHNLHYTQNKQILNSFSKLLNLLKKNKINQYSKLERIREINDVEYFILEFNIMKDTNILQNILKEILILSNTSQNDLINMFLIDIKSLDDTISYNELSDGEKSIFKVFTKILYRIIYFKEKTLFLDEPEIFLHPNWSKEFINLLIKLTNNFDLEKLNVIITSHSPFLLSDIPRENVIFLEKGKQKYPFKENEQTFGANIHSLLSDGFFMKDGLMGEFAKGKIEEIKKFYELVKSFEDSIKEQKKPYIYIKLIYLIKIKKFRYIQSIIGEPFLQTIIKNYLDELEQIFDNENFEKNKLEEFIKEFGKDKIEEYLKKQESNKDD